MAESLVANEESNSSTSKLAGCISYGRAPTVFTGDNKEQMIFNIHNFSTLPQQNDEFIETEIIAACGRPWFLRINPRGTARSRTDNEYTAIFLMYGGDNDKSNPVVAKANFKTKTIDYDLTSMQHKFSNETKSTRGFGVYDFSTRQNLIEQDCDDVGTLTITVEIEVTVETRKIWYPRLIPSDIVRTTLYGLRDESSDVTFIVGKSKKELLGHQCIILLRAKSLHELIITEEASSSSSSSCDAQDTTQQRATITNKKSRFMFLVADIADRYYRTGLARLIALLPCGCCSLVAGCYSTWLLLLSLFVCVVVDGCEYVSFKRMCFFKMLRVRSDHCLPNPNLLLRAKSLHELIITEEASSSSSSCDAQDTAQLELSDIDEAVFELMLEFFYTDRIPKITNDDHEKAQSILLTCDRFGCTDLKLYMESVIVEKFLIPSTVAHYLLLADSHSCALLKEAALKMYLADSKAVKGSNTEDWNRLKESGDLLEALLDYATSEKKKYVPIVNSKTSTTTATAITTATTSTIEDNIDEYDVTSLRERLEQFDLDVDGSREMLANRWTEYLRTTTSIAIATATSNSTSN